VDFFFEREVQGLEKVADIFHIKTGKGNIQARFVVNAAGLFSDRINAMVGARAFSIRPRRGEYVLLDTNVKGLAKSILFQPPTSAGKGVLVTPTVDGNILIGPTAEPVQEKTATETTEKGQRNILEVAKRTIPELTKRFAINSFSGLRATPFIDEKQYADFIIEEDGEVEKFFTLGGIASPGLAAAPSIAEAVRDLLDTAGLVLKEKKDFKAHRKPFVYFARASEEEKQKLVRENPLYARIICRCEMVTEAEIIKAIHSPIGAMDLDGVKRRTRAQMGRCQGGFCLPRIAEIISRERAISMTEVSKSGRSSFVLQGKTREGIE
jgi:glycerol-3-phosphate dehydrogenase